MQPPGDRLLPRHGPRLRRDAAPQPVGATARPRDEILNPLHRQARNVFRGQNGLRLPALCQGPDGASERIQCSHTGMIHKGAQTLHSPPKKPGIFHFQVTSGLEPKRSAPENVAFDSFTLAIFSIAD